MAFSMDGDVNAPVGLPLKSQHKQLYICISEGETVQEDYPSDSLKMIFLLKGDSLFVQGINKITKREVIGQFYVPPVYGVSFKISYDVETFKATIQPSRFYLPIRVGTWSFGNDSLGYEEKDYNGVFKPDIYNSDCSEKK